MGYTTLRGGGGGPSTSGYGPVPDIFSRHLDTNGDGSGTTNAIGDYSASAETFYCQPSAGSIFRVTRMLILIRAPSAKFYTDNYGSRDPLANGIVVRKQDDSGTLIDLTNAHPVQRNGEWGQFCFDAEIYPAGTGNNDSYLRVRWTFEKHGYPIRLVGDNNERIEVVLNDDFTLDTGTSDPLDEHYFVIQGYIENTT